MADRFRRAGSDRLPGDPRNPEFCGGNLQGVVEALPYLKKLGVNTLWLSLILLLSWISCNQPERR
ncbi:MAG: hypothetical protein JXR25_05090 [Pontiellaceae bacterium]|nr:hypothetical protein [Pontiellaceae bacterium]MBN2784183.1 hypothetical protein [Pontiellaceae bacterium]